MKCTSVIVMLSDNSKAMKSKMMILSEHLKRKGETRNKYKISVGKSEGKRLRCKWEDNIKINLTHM
jgi:hypothetical protein